MIADLAILGAGPAGMAAATEAAARGARVLQLTTSYRSVPAIQRFVNAAFAAEMTGNATTRQAADTERNVEAQRTRRNRFHLHRLA